MKKLGYNCSTIHVSCYAPRNISWWTDSLDFQSRHREGSLWFTHVCTHTLHTQVPHPWEYDCWWSQKLELGSSNSRCWENVNKRKWLSFLHQLKKIIYSAKHKVSSPSTSTAGLQGKVLIKKRKQELPGSPVVKTPCSHAEGTGLIAGWGSKTYVPHNIAKREREKQANSLHDIVINFARRQEIEKIFPAKM